MDRNSQIGNSTFAPCMVINPGETFGQAVARHRRDTGHDGHIIVVAWNRGTRAPTRVLGGEVRHAVAA